MEPAIVKNYLEKIKSLGTKVILLRNLREGKQVKKGTELGVESPTLRDHYINFLEEYKLIASDAHRWGYTTHDGYHSELLLFKKN